MIRWLKKLFGIKTDIIFVRALTAAAHIGVLASVWYWWTTPWMFGLAFCSAVLMSVFMDIGYHRYYSHRAFTATKAFEILTVVFTLPLAVGSPMAWAGLHRYHHKHSDTSLDPHSPVNMTGLEMMSLDYDYSRFEQTIYTVKDFVKNPWHVWLHHHYFDLVIALYACCALVSPSAFIVICAYPAVYNYWQYMVTNYLEHVAFPLSERPFKSGDNSVNNIILNWGTLGHTGLHNNHHAFPGSWRYDLAGRWWEFDSGKWAARLFHMLGLIRIDSQNPTA